MMTLDTQLINLPSIPKNSLKKLSKLGIETVEDLLRHIPSRYDDFSQVSKIEDVRPHEMFTIEGTVQKISTKRTWKKKMIVTEALIEDDTGSIEAVWFGLRNLDRQIKPERRIRISGKVSLSKNKLIFQSPSFELASREATHTGRLVPTYPETQGLTSKWLRWKIQSFLKSPLVIEDPLPQELLEKLHLPSLKQALTYVHFPSREDHWRIAHKRFAFEEMFLLQLRSLQVKQAFEHQKAVILPETTACEEFIRTLPFILTPDQKTAVHSISKDLEKTHPMNRLLNGDVGSGKTVVALIAMLQTTHAGYQSALLAPTEVLALQHFKNIQKLLEGSEISFALLTNSYQMIFDGNELRICNRTQLLEELKSGNIEIVIGTHAIIQKDIRFHNLALVIVDEQHRFGVQQRAYLQQSAGEINDGLKNTIPHFLTMTATPIPRTLSLAFFGNLDISLLETMPKGRKPIQTKIVPPRDREKVYAFIRSEIQKGHQAYVILPLVEESKALKDIKAATEEHARLQKEIFPDLRLGLLHGKLPSKGGSASGGKATKENVIKQFKERVLDILVATSVVEVGVDVPNATVMIIEDAERFGLSQLHQFRGRVGRSEHQSYCFLFTSSNTSTARQRLKALEATNSGFKIAQKDLELRGPGEFFGTQQSGLPDIAMENITNIKLITIAREEAENLLRYDPKLQKNPFLKKELGKFEAKAHLE